MKDLLEEGARDDQWHSNEGSRGRVVQAEIVREGENHAMQALEDCGKDLRSYAKYSQLL